MLTGPRRGAETAANTSTKSYAASQARKPDMGLLSLVAAQMQVRMLVDPLWPPYIDMGKGMLVSLPLGDLKLLTWSWFWMWCGVTNS